MGSSAHNFTDITQKLDPVHQSSGERRKLRLSPSHLKKQLPNIVLIVGVLALLGSISYAVTVTQTSQDTQASEVQSQTAFPTPTIGVVEIPPDTTPLLAEYPTTYQGVPIPQEYYEEGMATYDHLDEAVANRLVIDRVVEYYIYRGLMVENGIELPADTSDVTYTPLGTDPETFRQIEIELSGLKEATIDGTVTHRDFYFLPFQILHNTEEQNSIVEEQIGRPREEAALDLAQQYKEAIEENPDDIVSIMTRAGNDETMRALNGMSDYSDHYRVRFTQSDELLGSDEDEFMMILFSLESGEVSEPFSYSIQTGKKHGYMVIYVEDAFEGTYDSREDFIADSLERFN